MKKSEIKQIIKEEITKVLGENPYNPDEDEFENPNQPKGKYIDDDGWDDEDALDEVGLMGWINQVEKVAYELRNGRRGSYAIEGDTDEDLIMALKGLRDEFEYILQKMEDEVEGYGY